VQDYLGKIDKDSPIVLKPENLLSAADLAAVNLHVSDCGLWGTSCNYDYRQGSYYDSFSP